MFLIYVGFRFKGRVLLWFVFLFSVLTILLEVVFLVVSAILGAERALTDAWWMKLIRLIKVKSWSCMIPTGNISYKFWNKLVPILDHQIVQCQEPFSMTCHCCSLFVTISIVRLFRMWVTDPLLSETEKISSWIWRFSTNDSMTFAWTFCQKDDELWWALPLLQNLL